MIIIKKKNYIHTNFYHMIVDEGVAWVNYYA